MKPVGSLLLALRKEEEYAYRLLWPFDILRIFFLFDPRGVVRFAFGAAFFRAARFNSFRSALSSIFVVFAIMSLSGVLSASILFLEFQ